MLIKHQSSALGTCLFKFSFFLGTPPYIHEVYRELKRTTFAIPALTKYQVLTYSKSDIIASSKASM
jgi:hypothetical protein